MLHKCINFYVDSNINVIGIIINRVVPIIGSVISKSHKSIVSVCLNIFLPILIMRMRNQLCHTEYKAREKENQTPKKPALKQLSFVEAQSRVRHGTLMMFVLRKFIDV